MRESGSDYLVISNVMSFLFHKKTRKAMRWIWTVLAVLIIISMVLLFAPGLIPGTGIGGHNIPL